MAETVQDRLLAAIAPHVAFDGWSEAAFAAACADIDVSVADGLGACPRGAVDLAAAYHRAGDDLMRAALEGVDLDAMRIRERVAFAVRARIEAVSDKEVVRRGAVLFALPMHGVEGTRLIWGTADAIWDALGDPSEDLNWYFKRALLSGVYSSTVLFWLGDDSVDGQDTWEFLDSRIEDVMRIKGMKGQLRATR